MANMKFYFTPGACSMGIHILLEQLELVYEAYPVNLIKGEQYRPEFLTINPKGSVPVLVLEDGSALTDFLVISWWLAKSYPKAGLLTDSLEQEVAVIERINYVVNTIHGQGFTRIFTTDKYRNRPDDDMKVKTEGRDIVERGLAVIDRQLAVEEMADRQINIADAALFYVEFWAEKTDIPLPEHCRTHYQTLLQQPAVRQVLMEEGYHTTLLNQPLKNVGAGHATA